jgi:hypothetical protein
MEMKDPAEGMPALRTLRSLYNLYEEDVLTCLRFIEPTIQNMRVHSLELYQLHIKICAAITSLFNLWYVQKGWRPKHGGNPNITDFYPLLNDSELCIEIQKGLALSSNTDIIVRPLSEWSEEENTPSWWKDYNLTKHELNSSSYLQGNLDNVLNSLGAFYLILNDKRTRSTYPVGTRVFRTFNEYTIY